MKGNKAMIINGISFLNFSIIYFFRVIIHRKISSTIVVFNGAEYEVKASNVDPKHWKTLSKLQDVP